MRLDGYVHRTGEHGGSTALRNLVEFYEWEFVEQPDEAACFGIGSGLGFTFYEPPERSHPGFVGRTDWMEEAFFEHLDISHVVHEGQSFDTAWADVRNRLEEGDPVLLFLDPTQLDYVEERQHYAAYPVVAVGYEDDEVVVSDGMRNELLSLPQSTLQAAWGSDRTPHDVHRHAAVTDPKPGADLETAASRGLRETTGLMLDPYHSDRTTGDLPEHGVPAIRSLAASVHSWDDLSESEWVLEFASLNVARRGSEGAAYRDFYADALEFLAPRTGVGGGLADRMRGVADDWRAVADAFHEANVADDETVRTERIEEASSTLAGIADEEEQLFQHVRQELD